MLSVSAQAVSGVLKAMSRMKWTGYSTIKRTSQVGKENRLMRGGLYCSDFADFLFEVSIHSFVNNSSWRESSLVPSLWSETKILELHGVIVTAMACLQIMQNNTRVPEAMDRRYCDCHTKHTFQISSLSSVQGIKRIYQKQEILAALALYGGTPCAAKQDMQVSSVLRSYQIHQHLLHYSSAI